jgi:hypothetical protein
VTPPVGMTGGIMGMLFRRIVGTSAGWEGGRLDVRLRRGLLRHVGELGRVGKILGLVVVMVIGLELVADGRVYGRLALLCVCDWSLPLNPCLSCRFKVHSLGPFLYLGEGKRSFFLI